MGVYELNEEEMLMLMLVCIKKWGQLASRALKEARDSLRHPWLEVVMVYYSYMVGEIWL